jgi:hypothetical protein
VDFSAGRGGGCAGSLRGTFLRGAHDGRTQVRSVGVAGGFVAGPNPSLEDPLGVGGEKLHDWAVATAAFRERHGGADGETGVDSDVLAEIARSTGATVVGRRMFSGGQGPWEDDPNPNASWWGDDPPFHHPVFVLTTTPGSR